MKRWKKNVKLYQARERKRRRRLAIFLLCLFFLIVSGAILYVIFVVDPIVIEASSQAIYSLSTSAVSDAVYDVLSEDNISYDMLVSIEYDDQGKINLISLDTVQLNIITRKFYQVAQVYLDEMCDVGVNVPAGAFTGLPFLSGVGWSVNLKLTSIGAMTSVFVSDFSSAGINQTKHSLYISLHASVSLILPCYSSTIDSTTEVLIAESVIIGDVPEVYLSSGFGLTYSADAT